MCRGEDEEIHVGRRNLIKGLAATSATSLISSTAIGAIHRDGLTSLSASQIRNLVVTRQVSAVEVTEYFLARIERLEPLVHAFLYVDGSAAIDAAKRLDAALARGKQPGLLAGVPIAIKDQILVKGMPATAGSLLFAKFQPTIDSTIVERLRAADAIIVGKTNMAEFASWPRSRTYLGGEALNPWDRTRIAGASSGGSAAAVAAGMVPVAIGTDGGGSTRIPASLCGVVGLFPTVGRVPDYGGFHFGSGGSAGPIAKSVADAALIQKVIAGPDPRIPSALTEAAPDVLSHLDAGVSGLRIAWSRDFGRVPVDPLVIETARAASDVLARAGAKVEEFADRIEHPWGEGAFLAALQTAVAAGDYRTTPEGRLPDTTEVEAWLRASSERPLGTTYDIPAFRAFYTEHAGLLTPPQRLAIKFPPTSAANPSVEELRTAMRRIFATYDVLCSPTMAVVAPVARSNWASPYDDMYMGTNFTFIANATACPAVTVPCGFVRDLPVGFQIIGRPCDEPTVLRVARSLEKGLPAQPLAPLALA